MTELFKIYAITMREDNSITMREDNSRTVREDNSRTVQELFKIMS
jgi:hypothetical protein